MGQMALRQNAILPRLVNSDYSDQAAQQGETVDISIPSAIAVQSVVPGPTPPSTADLAPTNAQITLDNWEEAPFYLTDADKAKIASGSMPQIVSEAVKSLVNKVDQDLAGVMSKFYGAIGTAGTTPFGSGVEEASAADLRTQLNLQLAPMGDRRAILDPIADGAASKIRAFNDTSYSGSSETLVEGLLGRKFGFDWYMDQNVATHTAGTLSNGSNPVANVNGTDINTVGAKGPFNVDETTLTGTLVQGDIVTFANHSQQYVVTNASTLTAAANALTGITIEPGIVVAVPDNTVMTVVQSHVLNAGFHRDAIGFATRPLLDEDAAELGSIIRQTVDPVSGLTLRLEIRREHKRTRYSFDMLYGFAVVRRELGARLLG